MNLPATLAQQGYRKPHRQAHYPQGLVSCLYQLKSRIPYDFELNNPENERVSAEKHLRCLHRGDLVVYDRGYYSYALLYSHIQTGIHAVFRLKTDHTFIKLFLNGQAEETVVQVNPPDKQGKTQRDLPEIKTRQALPLRLIQYTIEGKPYYLGTTLMDSACPAALFKELYHARWGIEERYKISKTFIDVEDFHAKSERGVKQALYAHFVLITLGRLFSNKAEIALFDESQPHNVIGNEAHQCRVNFKSCLQTLMNAMEELFFLTSHHLKKTLLSVEETIARNRYKNRNGRSYQRRSFKPVGKWSRTSKQAKGSKKKGGNAVASCVQASGVLFSNNTNDCPMK